MKILTDLHTHTLASSHAYSTLYENITAAKQKGLEMIAMTDHAPTMPDAPHPWHFIYFKAIPREVEGIRLLCGVEANILNSSGELDISENVLSDMDIVIASIHNSSYDEDKGGDHTKTWMNIIDNPYVDVLGHSGSPDYMYDIDTVLPYAKAKGKCIEINNHSFVTRPENIERCREIALACIKYQVPVAVNSDAHFMAEVGLVSKAVDMLEEIDFPESLIMNLNADRVINYISDRSKKINFGE